MKKPFMQVASDGVYEVIVEGVISSELWWGDEFTPDTVREELATANGKPIRIVINSPGGECYAGAAIYNAFLNYQGRKTVRVDGIAASMASVIAMVGDEILMSPGSTMMVHRPSSLIYGNIRELENEIEALKSLEDTLFPIYEKRTGLSSDKVFELLDNTTWMSPQQAIELGFADKMADEQDEDQSSNMFANIEAMLKDKQFAFQMSAMHKSLEDYVAHAEASKEETEVETEETKEVEVTEVNDDGTVEAVVDGEEVTLTPDEQTQEAIVEADADTSVEETTEQEESTDPQDSETNKPVSQVKEKIMGKPIAADMVVTQAEQADPVASTVEVKKMTKTEARKLIVNALAAKYSKDEQKFTEINDRLKSEMVIDGTSGAPIYGQEVLANDIRQAYTNVGRVGALVNRIDIDGAETFKQLVETAGNGFTEVALGKTKDLDQPVWSGVTFEPFEWALIVAWLDGVQKRSPIAVYNQIVRYIAKSYAKLEDKIVLTYAGATIDGEVRPATGLVPILTTADRVTPVASYDSSAVLPALATAYGAIESDDTITLVANRKTWANLAVSTDGEARPLFTVVGEQVAAGALGTFNVVLSSVLADGDVVVGAYDDYNLVTRGGLEYLFSREATVGTGDSALNLFTNDASALRADIDITGKPVVNTSFQLLQFATS